MVDKKIRSTLETLGAPVARIYYKGSADTFLTYQLVLGARSVFYDDVCEGTEYIYRADVYSKNNHLGMVGQAVAALETLECYGITIDPEVYENTTGYYHVPITFKIMEV